MDSPALVLGVGIGLALLFDVVVSMLMPYVDRRIYGR